MKINKDQIPVSMEAPDTIMRTLTGYGGMTVAFNQIPGLRLYSTTKRISK